VSFAIRASLHVGTPTVYRQWADSPSVDSRDLLRGVDVGSRPEGLTKPIPGPYEEGIRFQVHVTNAFGNIPAGGTLVENVSDSTGNVGWMLACQLPAIGLTGIPTAGSASHHIVDPVGARSRSVVLEGSVDVSV